MLADAKVSHGKGNFRRRVRLPTCQSPSHPAAPAVIDDGTGTGPGDRYRCRDRDRERIQYVTSTVRYVGYSTVRISFLALHIPATTVTLMSRPRRNAHRASRGGQGRVQRQGRCVVYCTVYGSIELCHSAVPQSSSLGLHLPYHQPSCVHV